MYSALRPCSQCGHYLQMAIYSGITAIVQNGAKQAHNLKGLQNYLVTEFIYYHCRESFYHCYTCCLPPSASYQYLWKLWKNPAPIELCVTDAVLVDVNVNCTVRSWYLDQIMTNLIVKIKKLIVNIIRWS